jgi:hypothetical protein
MNNRREDKTFWTEWKQVFLEFHLLVFVYIAVLIGVIFWTGFLKLGLAVL